MSIPMATHKWAETYPELGTAPVPTEPCISADYFEREREAIFRRTWLNIGRVEDVPSPGSYIVKDLPVAKTSVIVIHGKEGTIRAFHNMCSHRGNRLAWDTHGRCQALTCKFHGWSYTPDGRLTFVPDEANFFDFDKSSHGLTQVALDIWEGFLFINLDPQPTESLQEFMGILGEQLSGYPFHTMELCSLYTIDVQCNWKVALDAFQEIYHVGVLHRRTIGTTFSGPDNPFCHALTIQLYPKHRMMSLYANVNRTPSPVEALSYQFGSVVTQGVIAGDQLPVGVNPTGSPQWAFDLNVIFPNFSVDVSAGTYVTHHFWPLAVNHTRWETRLFVLPAQSVGQRFSQEVSKCLLRDTLLEDGKTLEATQAALSSGVKSHFNLQDEEVLVRHSYKVVEDTIQHGKG